MSIIMKKHLDLHFKRSRDRFLIKNFCLPFSIYSTTSCASFKVLKEACRLSLYKKKSAYRHPALQEKLFYFFPITMNNLFLIELLTMNNLFLIDCISCFLSSRRSSLEFCSPCSHLFLTS